MWFLRTNAICLLSGVLNGASRVVADHMSNIRLFDRSQQVAFPGQKKAVLVLVASIVVGMAVIAAVPAGGEASAVTADLQQDNETELVEFTASSQGGYIAFSEGSQDDAVAGGTVFPDEDEDEQIEIEATVEDGEWEATATTFPPLPVTDDLYAEVVASDLAGEIDPETGEMTVRGEFEVTIQDASFTFESEQTTGESNALSGEADFDSEPATVTLVDNEFTVEDETENEVVNRVLELPATDEGENWFQLELAINIGEEQTDESDQNGEDAGQNDEESDQNDGNGSSDEEDAQADDSIALAMTVLGQAAAVLGLGGAVIMMTVTLVARYTGFLSFDS